ncbi:hypothetical protein BCS94_09920 [Vibrio breoganii]|uniref:oligosaccharide flippase family protein n=1 Tax=Vibrio breoganii TaxID=553239 RepID=UPI000C84525D|nr:oligosaccharide flippase family protein [Vibrio breoganii]PMP07273.1 hypothetical protein BCS94_09920 [Vibrio breoganii]
MKINEYIRNSIWLIADKFLVLLGGLIATTLVAKFLGPKSFGVLSYGLTLSLFLTALSQWGASFLIFNAAARNVSEAENIILNTLRYRILVYITCTIILSTILFFRLEYDEAKFIAAICISNIFLGLDVYQYYFNGSLRSSLNTRITFVAKLASIIIKLSLIAFDSDLFLFFIPILIEGGIVFFLKHNTFRKVRLTFDGKSQFDLVKVIKEGAPYLVSSFLVLAYTKANDIVLRELTSFVEVGLFSAGLLLSNAWTFIPLSVGTSFLTKAIKSKDEKDFAFTYFISILVSTPVLIFIFIFPELILRFSFGEKYRDLVELLPLLSIGSLLGVLVFLNNRHISNYKNGGSYLIKKTCATALFSVFTSIILVHIYGIKGAVYSWVIVQLFAISLANIFYSEIKWKVVLIQGVSMKAMLTRLKEFT